MKNCYYCFGSLTQYTGSEFGWILFLIKNVIIMIEAEAILLSSILVTFTSMLMANSIKYLYSCFYFVS